MGFRHDIGFLRSIAVISVVFFHFQVPYFSGGFIGVDIFFVLSGYLMTSIILKGFQKQDFSFTKFYQRRAIRILPALLFMLAVLCIVGIQTLLPKDFETLSKYALESGLFISNLAYYKDSGYFAPSAQSNFLLHTWSLSVEWQFYLIYPVLLRPLKNLYLQQRKVFIPIFIGMTLLSFIGMSHYASTDQSLVFYMFPFRAWEMLAGGFIFLLQDKIRTPLYLRKFLVFIFYSGIIISILYFDEKNITWPSYYTLIPVLSTMGIILLKDDSSLIRFKPFQFIGKISYSWYLWHWPIYVFVAYFSFEHEYITLPLIFISLLPACISYYVIEQNKVITHSPNTNIYIFGTLILFAIMAYFPLFQHTQDSEISYLSSYNSNYVKNKVVNQFRKGRCHVEINNTFEQYDKTTCLSFSSNKKNILLIGDSHAGVFAQSMLEKFERHNLHLLQATVSTTYPLLQTKGPQNSVKLTNFILHDFIPKHRSKIDKVLISAFWGSGQYEPTTLKKKILQLTAYLKKNKIDYQFIGQTKAYKKNYPEILALEKRLGKKTENNYILQKPLETNNFLKTFLTEEEYVDVYDFPFVKYDGENCHYFDDDHLSKFGADQIVEFLLRNKKI